MFGMREGTEYGIVARSRDVFVRPKTLFVKLGGNVPWIGSLLLASILVVGSSWLLWRSDVGEALVLQAERRLLDSARGRIPEESYAQLENRLYGERASPGLVALGEGTRFVATVLVSAFGFRLFLGFLFSTNLVRFGHVLGVCSHAALIVAAFYGLNNALTYLVEQRVEATSGMGVAQWLGWPERPLWAINLVGGLDAVMFWAACVVGVGLAALYRSSARGLALAVCLSYLVLRATIAILPSAGFTLHGFRL